MSSQVVMEQSTRGDIALLIGDHELREDPKKRRDLAAKIFSAALVSNWTLSDASEISILCDLLLSALHDPWSEIRKESARSLTKLSRVLSQEFCLHALQLLLDHLHDLEQWQVIHGNMLGITALSLRSCVDSVTHAEVLQKVKTYCLKALSHNTLFVRESARICFSTLFLQGGVVRELEELIERCVKADMETHSEGHSFPLQSYLDCLGDYLRSHPAEFLQSIRNALLTTGTRATIIISKSMHLVELCMQHLSSTVRFAAGHLLTSIFFACEKAVDIDIADHVVSLICMAIGDKNHELWRRREGFLIAARDIIHSCAASYLHLICTAIVEVTPHQRDDGGSDICLTSAPTTTVPTAADTTIVNHHPLMRLVLCMHHTLPGVIQDPGSFELRRIAAQILPPLVRCGMFLSVYNILNGSVSTSYDIEIVSATGVALLPAQVLFSLFGHWAVRGSNCSGSNSGNGDRNSSSSSSSRSCSNTDDGAGKGSVLLADHISISGTGVTDDIFLFCFAAEVAKTTKLITEAIGAVAKARSKACEGRDEDVDYYRNSSRHIYSYNQKLRNSIHADVVWAMNVPRRLGEEDTRLAVLSEVTAVTNALLFGQICFMGEILLDIFEHRVLPALYNCTKSFCSEGSIYRHFTSADLIEGVVACSGVCQCLGDADEETHPDMSATLSYAIQSICDIQLHVPSHNPQYGHGSLGSTVNTGGGTAVAACVDAFLSSICGGHVESITSTAIESEGVGLGVVEDKTPSEAATKISTSARSCIMSITDPTGTTNCLTTVGTAGNTGQSTTTASSSLLSSSSSSVRRPSFVAKYALLDKWVCEAISPVLAASAHLLTQTDLTVLVAICILWLDRILSDPQWLSIKPTSKKSVLDFIAAAILRMEIILTTPSNLHIDHRSLHAILLVSIPVLRISFSRDDNSVSVQLVKLCRISRDVMLKCFDLNPTPVATDTTSSGAEIRAACVEERPFALVAALAAFTAVQEVVIEFHDFNTRSRNVSNCSDTNIDSTAASLDDVRIHLSDSPGSYSKQPEEGVVVGACDNQGLDNDDSFSDWDESEGEDTAMFEINKGSTPQTLYRKNSSVYLAEELDLFLISSFPTA